MEELYNINEKLFPNLQEPTAELELEIQWGNDTLKVINAEKLIGSDDSGILIVQNQEVPEGEQIVLVDSQQQTTQLLNDAIQRAEQGTGRFFKRIGMSPSTYADVTNGRRPISRNLVINCIFMSAPSVKEANHILMELRCPCFYTNITRVVNDATKINSRNYVFKCVLSWMNAIQENGGPDILPNGYSYLGFLQMVLNVCKLDPTVKEQAELKVPQLEDCSPAVQELIKNLWEKSGKILSTPIEDTMRRSILKEHRAGQTQNAVTAECIAETHYGEDHVKGVLTARRRGDRETIIRLYHHLGCGLEEVNQILQASNYALIYPRNQGEDYIQLLR